MIRALKIAALGGLISLLASCTGGGGETTPAPGEELALLLFAISPTSGTSPLQATLTAVVEGGTAPYDFAWDFENDGSFDAFTNNTFDTTVSRNHQYNLRAADAGGSSTYQAIVRVTDSEGVIVTSEPQSAVVTSNPDDLIIGPPFLEDEFGNEIDPTGHVFESGDRVRFHFGDRSDLEYQWDFEYQTIDISKPLDQQISPLNPAFTVDSTQVSPSHVYHNTGNTPLIYVAKVRVTDPRTGEVIEDTINISVGSTLPPVGDRTLEGEISSSPAPDSNGVITLRFDPTGGSGNDIPLEPTLELAGQVSSDPEQAGDPPYEFYWDYENDGKIDKAAQSATIPYYDPINKVTVNPYLHSDDERLYEVRLMVVDIKGRISEVVRTIRSLNVGNRPPAALNFTVDWGFGASPRQPFETADGPAVAETANWTIVPRGGTEIYEFKLDIDGDGLGDFDYVDGPDVDTNPDTIKLTPGADKWLPIALSGETLTVVFGPHPDPDDTNVPPATINQYPVPNYYAANVIVRALDAPGGSQVDIMTRQTPVSMVQVGSVDESNIPQLPLVQDHVLVGIGQTLPGGGNGRYLAMRGIMVAGGAQGTTALRDTFRVTETFTAPTDPGALETSDEFTFDQLTPMTVARRGHGGFITTNDPDHPTTDLSLPPAAQTVAGAPVAGGAMPIGTFRYLVVPRNGSYEGMYATQAESGNVTTNNANRTVNLTWAQDPDEPVPAEWAIYRSSDGGGQFGYYSPSFITTVPGTQLNYSDDGSPAVSNGMVLTPPALYVWGGRNPAEGALATGEFLMYDPAATSMTWTLSTRELRPSGSRLPLFDFGNSPYWDPAFRHVELFTGGLHQPAPFVNATVSNQTFFAVPQISFEPTDDGWAPQGANLQVPRYDVAVVSIGSTFYAIGGRTSAGQATATVEKWTLGVDANWVQLPNMRDARAGASAEVIDADGPTGPKPPQIYVYGGAFFPTQSGSRTLVSSAEVFNPVTQTWSYTVRPQVSSYAAGSARLPGPGSVENGLETFNTVWYYGGEVGETVSAGETNNLEEFIYFYNLP